MHESTKMEDLKNYYENIIAKLPGHVFWKNRDAVLQGCNDLQAKDLGFKSREEIVGKTNYDMIVHYTSEEDRKRQADEISRADFQVMDNDTTVVVEEPLMLPTGEKRIYLSNKSPLHDKNGNVIGLLGIAFDVTAEKEAEKLQQEKIAAEQRSEYLRAAAGSIAHELRTPLASIEMSTAIIKKYWKPLINISKKAKEAGLPVEGINFRNIDLLENIVESITSQTRFSNTFIDLVLGNLKEGEIDRSNYHSCDLKSIVDRCLSTYPFVENESSLVHWESDKTFAFHGNEDFMMNVLNNLIKNALYFIKAAGKGEIYIWVETDENQNTLYFKDTAKGAPPEVVANLFKSFYSKRQGGTGLGLTFCKKIMNSFDGDITATSVEGEYMQFILSFPTKSHAG